LPKIAEKCRKAESLNAVKAELEELRHIADELLGRGKTLFEGGGVMEFYTTLEARVA